MADEITIRLPDGSTRALATGTTAADLAASIGSRLAKAAVIAVVNGEQRDLATVLNDGDEVAIVTSDRPAGPFPIRPPTSSDERPVGKECVSRWRSRLSQYH